MIPHTADTGFRATAPTVSGLFEEAAVALAHLSFDVGEGAGSTASVEVELEAGDLPALAFAWLNELIGRAEVARSALVAVTARVAREPAGPAGEGRWRLSGRCDLRRLDAGNVRPRRPPKSATFHGLSVRREGRVWEMVAYLDV